MGEARTRVCCSSLSLRRTGDDLASLHKGFKIRLASIVPVSLEFTDDISIKRQLSEPANISWRSRVPGGGDLPGWRQNGVLVAYISGMRIEEKGTSFHAGWTSVGFTILCFGKGIASHCL